MKKIDASFIIVNYNGQHYLDRLIKSIQNQTNKSFEIIIVDNDSTDNSVDFLNKNFPNFKLIRSSNIGFGLGCNLGAKNAKGEFLLFFNPDSYLTNTFLAQHLKFFKEKSLQYPEPIGCLGSPNKDFDSSSKLTRLFGGGVIDIFGTPRESTNPNLIEDSLFVFGNGLFIKRSLFEKVKGFTPNIFLYAEEIDLCWRLKIMGFRHLMNNQNMFFHVGGGSKFGDNRPRQIALMTYGCFLDSFTNYQTLTFLLLLPFYLLYLLAIIVSLTITKKFNFSYATEIIIAFKKFFTDYKKIISFRQFVQKNRKLTDFKILKYISLIPSILLH
jgi:GT2 family glycosyltransferase